MKTIKELRSACKAAWSVYEAHGDARDAAWYLYAEANDPRQEADEARDAAGDAFDAAAKACEAAADAYDAACAAYDAAYKSKLIDLN